MDSFDKNINDMVIVEKILYESRGEHIGVMNFIEAVARIHHLLNKFGKTFKSVQYMMQQDLNILKDRYKFLGIDDVDLKYLTFQEIASGETKATEAVRWLSRYLSCVQYTFHCIWKARNNGIDDFTPILRKSFHSIFHTCLPWFGQQMFKALSKYCPSPKVIVESLRLDENEDDEALYRRIRSFESSICSFISQLNNYYTVFALETQISINAEQQHITQRSYQELFDKEIST